MHLWHNWRDIKSNAIDHRQIAFANKKPMPFHPLTHPPPSPRPLSHFTAQMYDKMPTTINIKGNNLHSFCARSSGNRNVCKLPDSKLCLTDTLTSINLSYIESCAFDETTRETNCQLHYTVRRAHCVCKCAYSDYMLILFGLFFLLLLLRGFFFVLFRLLLWVCGARTPHTKHLFNKTTGERFIRLTHLLLRRKKKPKWKAKAWENITT